MSLQKLLDQGQVWRAGATRANAARCRASGHAVLDETLGGWPRGSVIELLADEQGAGELGVVLPVLADLTRLGQWVVLVNPPYVPYAPAWQRGGVRLDRLLWVRSPGTTAAWSLEQALRAPGCGAVLGWCAGMNTASIRRLQLAAEDNDALAFLYRPPAYVREPSPAALRLLVNGSPTGPRLEVLKRRGGRAGDRLAVNWH